MPIVLLSAGCERRSASELHQAAEAALKQGNKEEAIELLQKALKLNPNHEEANYRLGRLYKEQKKEELAVLHFQKAAEADDQDVKNLYRYGDALLDVGETDKAIEVLTRATNLEDKMGGVYAKLAQAYRRKNDENSARAILQQGLQVIPSSDPFHEELSKQLSAP